MTLIICATRGRVYIKQVDTFGGQCLILTCRRRQPKRNTWQVQFNIVHMDTISNIVILQQRTGRGYRDFERGSNTWTQIAGPQPPDIRF